MADFCQTFNVRHPIVLAPMGGGPGTTQLANVVADCGGLASLAAAYLTPAQLKTSLSQIPLNKSLVNLFVPHGSMAAEARAVQQVADRLQNAFAELQLAPPVLPFEPAFADFETMFSLIEEARPRAFSFVFGIPDETYLRRCRKHGILSIGTCTDLDEALLLQDAGVDAIVAQGFEGGGHRAMFSETKRDPELLMLDLLRILKTKIKVPLIAAGGIGHAKNVRAALDAGASAVQVGTAFLNCPEAGTNAAYRQALQNWHSRPLVMTRAYSGRWARGIQNQGTQIFADNVTLPWPLQNVFTRKMRAKAAEMNKPEFLSLWAGTGFQDVQNRSAKEIFVSLIP